MFLNSKVFKKRRISPTYSLLVTFSDNGSGTLFRTFKLFCFALRYSDCDQTELKGLWTSMFEI